MPVKFKLSAVTLALTSGLMGNLAFAQQQSEDEVEVVTVYAQKRAQDIRDVSIAVTRLDGEQLEKLQTFDTTQLATYVPNLKISTVSGEGTTPAFNIRGIGVFDYNTTTVSPIAIYSDDVVSGGANFLSSNLYDIESVEVLRGPQGTLFGRNTTGGAILVRSKMPVDTFEGYVKAGVAQQDTSKLNGAVNVPLANNTAARLAFNYLNYDYSMENTAPDGEGAKGGFIKQNLRLIVKTSGDNWQVVTKFDNESWQGKPKPVYSAGVFINPDPEDPIYCQPSQLGSAQCVDSFGTSQTTSHYWQTSADTVDKHSKHDTWGVSLNATYQINDQANLKYVAAYKDLDRMHMWDSDGYAFRVDGNRDIIEGSLGSDNQFASHEVSLTLEGNNWFWITGLYFLEEELIQLNDMQVFNGFRDIEPFSAGAVNLVYNNKIATKSTALYNQIDYRIDETYSVTAGLRYTLDTTDYHVIGHADFANPAFGKINDFWHFQGEVDDGEFSSKLGLTQKLNSDLSLYYSYSHGYKSGGYNGGYHTSPTQAKGSAYKPETLDAYEIGARYAIDDLNINGAFYIYDYKDQQVFINIPTEGLPFHVLRNAGDSIIRGLELESTYDFSQAVRLRLNLGYIPDADVGGFNDGTSVVAESRLPFTSKWNISGGVDYQGRVGQGNVIATLGFDYQSSYYFDQNENPYTEQKSYTLWHGRVAYELNQQWQLAIWGKNLTNEEYADLRFDSRALMGAITELRGEKRQLGIEAQFSF
ncbi:TonB-dependent receptor [Saccharobesus litoralis]|uniref:TonB-dependent receptor n=1 Tax=Saccharobesus litoralis TaxID=2172099 RepID=A0A2S0VQH4_9ALTE|nr:TonB-dependent receptor [Saccharobesus litoralis]AWB66439.1 TonB-dependent receptor [Saccharobesus litoralis]